MSCYDCNLCNVRVIDRCVNIVDCVHLQPYKRVILAAFLF